MYSDYKVLSLKGIKIKGHKAKKDYCNKLELIY